VTWTDIDTANSGSRTIITGFGGGLIVVMAGLVLVPGLPMAATDFLLMTGFGELELASTVILESVHDVGGGNFNDCTNIQLLTRNDGSIAISVGCEKALEISDCFNGANPRLWEAN
jgi:hypothetical protein